MSSELTRDLAAALSSSEGALTDHATGEVVALPALLARARDLARAVTPGERVALLAQPGARWVEQFLALLFGGAAAVPLPLGASVPELAHALAEARVTRVVTDAAHAPRLRDLALPTEGGAPSDDVALVLFTSGTTGKPKAAALTHANLAAQTRALREAWGITRADALTTSLPMHHLHGVVVAVLTCLTAGASVRTFQRFDARALLEDAAHATVLMTVPTILARLTDALDEFEAAAPDEHARLAGAVRALRLVTSGSAALPAALAARWRRHAGELPLERYGMTEIGIALSNPLDPAGRRARSVGRPLPGVVVEVLGDDGEPLGDALPREGELAIAGPAVFAGYLGPDGPRDARDARGFFRTGDVVRQVADGSFEILGRTSSDILKTGGEKVSALEIEEVLREHALVADVAVIGVPDEAWGERVVAVVVAADGADPLSVAPALDAFARERLSPWKRPKEVRVVTELPRNAMGKVQKQVLRG